jgi:hypothetical protein
MLQRLSFVFVRGEWGMQVCMSWDIGKELLPKKSRERDDGKKQVDSDFETMKPRSHLNILILISSNSVHGT